jgi:SAM-dependent methyltransferase
MLSDCEDAYGHAVLDFLESGGGQEIVERNDGFIQAGIGPANYFAPFRRWPPAERRALRFVRGRVLDVGCGAGRVALELQERGHDVVGIDLSPLAVEVARRRGVRDARVLAAEDVADAGGVFDTVVMFGNNFGLFGGAEQAPRLLRTLYDVTSARGRIVASSVDRSATDDPVHLAYHELNRSRGRMPGQLRLRVRYRDYATPWFDYLLASPDEMRELLAGTGWHLARTIDAADRLYAAVIEKSAPGARTTTHR